MRELSGPGLGLRLSGQRGVVYLEAVSGDDAQISGDPVAKLHLHNVTHHQLLSLHAVLLTASKHNGKLQGKTQK